MKPEDLGQVQRSSKRRHPWDVVDLELLPACNLRRSVVGRSIIK